MQVRGAPLIAIVAALGLAVQVYLKMNTFKTAKEASEFIFTSINYLRTSRPTAVNLFVATDELTYEFLNFDIYCNGLIFEIKY